LNINLREWFNGIISSEWKKPNDILEIQSHELLFGSRVNNNLEVIRCKKINLAEEFNIYLVINTMLISTRETNTIIQIHAVGKMMYLPLDFHFDILDSSENFLQYSTCENQDRWMRQEITGEFGEEFIVFLRLNNSAMKIFFTI
jgi:hypothetical protein